AEALGVSEGEWVHACCGHESTQLESDPKRLLQGLPSVGTVMALTRNPDAVHEKIGCYDHIHFFDKMGMAQVVNHEIDLRIFMRHWHRIYAVTQTKNGEALESLQVFDSEGRAVHKVFAQPETNREAWRTLVADMRVEPEETYPLIPVGVKPTADP